MKKILFLALCVVSTVFGANGVHRDGAKGIVIDTRTGLVWQDDAAAASTTATWANAITTCENLVLGGYSDWRLPTETELSTLPDYGRFYPAIDTTFVDTVMDGFYWSSSSYAAGTTSAWFVYFGEGRVHYADKGSDRFVRCVRGN